MDVWPRLLVWQTGLLLRRAARSRRRVLVRELSCYTTQAELDDLAAAVDRSPAVQAQEIRDLLRAQRGRVLGSRIDPAA
jgi:hypothetical protein